MNTVAEQGCAFIATAAELIRSNAVADHIPTFDGRETIIIHAILSRLSLSQRMYGLLIEDMSHLPVHDLDMGEMRWAIACWVVVLQNSLSRTDLVDALRPLARLPDGIDVYVVTALAVLGTDWETISTVAAALHIDECSTPAKRRKASQVHWGRLYHKPMYSVNRLKKRLDHEGRADMCERIDALIRDRRYRSSGSPMPLLAMSEDAMVLIRARARAGRLPITDTILLAQVPRACLCERGRIALAYAVMDLDANGIVGSILNELQYSDSIDVRILQADWLVTLLRNPTDAPTLRSRRRRELRELIARISVTCRDEAQRLRRAAGLSRRISRSSAPVVMQRRVPDTRPAPRTPFPDARIRERTDPYESLADAFLEETRLHARDIWALIDHALHADEPGFAEMVFARIGRHLPVNKRKLARDRIHATREEAFAAERRSRIRTSPVLAEIGLRVPVNRLAHRGSIGSPFPKRKKERS